MNQDNSCLLLKKDRKLVFFKKKQLFKKKNRKFNGTPDSEQRRSRADYRMPNQSLISYQSARYQILNRWLMDRNVLNLILADSVPSSNIESLPYDSKRNRIISADFMVSVLSNIESLKYESNIESLKQESNIESLKWESNIESYCTVS